MKHVVQLLLTGVFCSCISLGSCNLFNDDPKPKTELEKLPPATQDGKNTFGCLVNGKAWVTETSVDARAFYQASVLSIDASLTNNSFNQVIGLALVDENLSTKEYTLNNYPEGEGSIEELENNCRFITSLSYTGQLIVTHFDQSNLIISGTFEFEAFSADCSKVMKITNGRFDLNYAP